MVRWRTSLEVEVDEVLAAIAANAERMREEAAEAQANHRRMMALVADTERQVRRLTEGDAGGG